MKVDPLSLKIIKAIQYNNPEIVKKDSKILSVNGVDIIAQSQNNRIINKNTIRKR